jgi:hypothetical protein
VVQHFDQDDQVYSVQAAALTGLDLRVRRDSREWKPECTEALRTLVGGMTTFRNSSAGRLN